MKKLILSLSALVLIASSAFAQVGPGQSGNGAYPGWSFFIAASAGNAQGATDYLQMGSLGSTAAQATQATAASVWPITGVASNLVCRNATAADNSTGVTYTVYAGSGGSTASSLTCTTSTSGNTTKCSDTSDTATINAGDLITIKVVNGNSAAANGVTQCSFIVH